MRAKLEELRTVLPDPFRYAEELDEFFQRDAALALTRDGRKSAENLLQFIRSAQDPALVRVAVLLLSRLDKALFYDELLAIVASADREIIEAMEPGIWRIEVEPSVLARDLMATVSPDHPHPLLLLQRPAARAVKPRLIDLIQLDIQPSSVYAMYSLEYTLEPTDRALLVDRSMNSSIQQIRDLAGEYLAKLQPAPDDPRAQ